MLLPTNKNLQWIVQERKNDNSQRLELFIGPFALPAKWMSISKRPPLWTIGTKVRELYAFAPFYPNAIHVLPRLLGLFGVVHFIKSKCHGWYRYHRVDRVKECLGSAKRSAALAYPSSIASQVPCPLHIRTSARALFFSF